MNIKDIRRKNLRILARTAGGITVLSERLDRSQSQISHLIGNNPIKNIGDRLASHIEKTFNKPHGWLDHEHVAEEVEGTYHYQNIQPYYQVPLLSAQEAKERFLHFTKISVKTYSKYLSTNIPLTSDAFALRVENDCMETAQGPSFSKNCIIVLDTDCVPHNADFVLAKVKQDPSSTLLFRQLVFDGNRRYLKALNRQYPTTEMQPDDTICGVVRFMLMEFSS
ncbi:LexA family protein [Rickettsiella grylli]|uniref:Lambdoid prophage e14 repressor protein C2 n=1 Tax=Rickettsiella grylli TaxID=59196 RepID=A8PPD8_9COXI|nr:LexA family transcriptional repressor [Rickettsiella grylli]EDP46355.1 putative lambdoid prophage e14 repressor protein C2 [Rickettsiella grylli]